MVSRRTKIHRDESEPMSHEWGRAAEACKWQRAVPVRFMSVIVIAVASGIAVWLVRQTFVWTPLRGSIFPATRGCGGHFDRQSDRALSRARDGEPWWEPARHHVEVVPITSGTGETTFALSELARHPGSGRLVWRDLAHDHVRFHAQLQV